MSLAFNALRRLASAKVLSPQEEYDALKKKIEEGNLSLLDWDRFLVLVTGEDLQQQFLDDHLLELLTSLTSDLDCSERKELLEFTATLIQLSEQSLIWELYPQLLKLLADKFRFNNNIIYLEYQLVAKICEQFDDKLLALFLFKNDNESFEFILGNHFIQYCNKVVTY
jgi:hypothetical protein